MPFDVFLGWPPLMWGIAIFAVLLAGIVRGFTGFGFALVALGILNLVEDPKLVIPMVLILDLLAGSHMVPRVWKLIEWRIIFWLCVGGIPGVLIGVEVLVWLSADTMRGVISVAILAATALIWKGVGLRQKPGPVATTLTGIVSGFFSGSAAIPGPPVIILLLSSPIAVASVRATTIAFFILTDLYVLPNFWAKGLLTEGTIWKGVALAPAMLIGTLIGSRLFGITSPDLVKKAALVLLAVLGVVGVIKVIAGQI